MLFHRWGPEFEKARSPYFFYVICLARWLLEADRRPERPGTSGGMSEAR